MNKDSVRFVEQCYMENQRLYQRNLGKKNWDIIIITATNEKQAEAYRIQINTRKAFGFLPQESQFLVIPDPGDKLLGSGLSTVFSLYHASKNLTGNTSNIFNGKRILIIHSGGNSRRIPQCSILGKLFANIPREMPGGRTSSLFDELLIALSGLLERMTEGVIISCGDILPIFNHNQVNFNHKGIIGLSMKKPAYIGTRHGVFVRGQDYQVENFLHKASIDTLRKWEAIDKQGMVYIDTGLIWLNPEIASKMIQLVSKDRKLDQTRWNSLIDNDITLNFYSDFLPVFTCQADLDKYIIKENGNNSELSKIKRQIRETFNDDQMYMECLSPAGFIHCGTTMDFQGLFNNISRNYFLSWENKVINFSEDKVPGKCSVIQSYLGKGVQIGEGVIIENSFLDCCCKIGQNSIISYIYTKFNFRLKGNLVIQQIPLEMNKGDIYYVTLIYGVYDNPKERKNGTLMNKSWSTFLNCFNLKAEDVWTQEVSRTLWDARIYPVCSSREESLKIALYLQEPQKIKGQNLSKWKKAKKISMNESRYIADPEFMINQQLMVEDWIRSRRFIQSIIDGKWYKLVRNEIINNKNRLTERINIVLKLVEEENNYFNKMRIYRALAQLIHDISLETKLYTFTSLEDKAFECLNRLFFNNDISSNDENKFIHKKLVLQSAARVNLGGEFSDTPPYCLENGGTVINAAVSLNGKLPIKVTIKVIGNKVIECISRDLELHQTYINKKELLDFRNPDASFVLFKAALIISGIINERDNVSLQESLKTRGGGLRITTDVDIPKGSGLGTSSILGGTIIKGLNELLGRHISEGELFERILQLEQILTTGGGWQDQVGGLTPGIKLITTKPGIKQSIQYERLKLDKNTQDQLNKRYVLIFTGQSRLARKNLREIMGQYLLNNPDVVSHLLEIQKLAVLMKFHLGKGDIIGMARLMNQHYKMNKEINLGITNTYIEEIFRVCRHYIAGGMTCGAGGGGFIQLILNDSLSKEALRKKLKDVFPGSKIGLCEIGIVDKALVIEYL